MFNINKHVTLWHHSYLMLLLQIYVIYLLLYLFGFVLQLKSNNGTSVVLGSFFQISNDLIR